MLRYCFWGTSLVCDPYSSVCDLLSVFNTDHRRQSRRQPDGNQKRGSHDSTIFGLGTCDFFECLSFCTSNEKSELSSCMWPLIFSYLSFHVLFVIMIDIHEYSGSRICRSILLGPRFCSSRKLIYKLLFLFGRVIFLPF